MLIVSTDRRVIIDDAPDLKILFPHLVISQYIALIVLALD